MTEKIQLAHRERTAYVYVRQSTVQQVRHHQAGQQRQYALADHAQRLGFARTQVINDDLGRSGSGSQERPGFARLLAAVCAGAAGAAGAVFALDASRLARNNRDWHHLIDLCALTDTLLVDYDGVYDPRQLNARLLLGLKGTMSEFELGLLKQRADAARTQLIHRGAVLWDVPVGYVRGEDHELEMIPDRQVQEAIRGVFAKFREVGSARQVTIWYREEEIRTAAPDAGHAGTRHFLEAAHQRAGASDAQEPLLRGRVRLRAHRVAHGGAGGTPPPIPRTPDPARRVAGLAP